MGYTPWGCKESDMTALRHVCSWICCQVIFHADQSLSDLGLVSRLSDPRTFLFFQEEVSGGVGTQAGRRLQLLGWFLPWGCLLAFLVLAGSGTCWGSCRSCRFHLPVINSISCWRTRSFSICACKDPEPRDYVIIHALP